MKLKITKPVLLLSAFAMMLSIAACGQGMPSINPSTAFQTPDFITETPTPEPTLEPTPRVVTTIRGIFPGDQPAGLPAVFEQLNKRLDEDILARLELSWAAPKNYPDEIAAAAAAGEIDFFWCDSADLAGYAGKGLIAPIDGPMAEFGQVIYDNIDGQLFDTMMLDGKLMGIPSAGNRPLCDAGHALTLREDLRQKHGLSELNALENFELYFKAIKEKEQGIVPLSDANAAYNIMKAFGPEDFLAGTNYSVAFAINADGTVTCMNSQDAPSFKGAVGRVREWYMAGWLPKNILAVKDDTAMLTGGLAAATGGSALAAASLQAAVVENAPGAVLTDRPIFNNAKYLEGNGGNALCAAAGSENAGAVVQFWAWVFSSQDNYDLYCYGIEGVHYEIADGRIKVLNDSYASFPASMFQNMNFRRFPAGVSDEYIEAMRHWNDGAALSPLIGFAFDPEAVKEELKKVKAVYATYGPALNTGSADAAALLAEFGAKMKAAGQDKVVAEAQKQIDAFLASRQ